MWNALKIFRNLVRENTVQALKRSVTVFSEHMGETQRTRV
jgi:hypothetical protein